MPLACQSRAIKTSGRPLNLIMNVPSGRSHSLRIAGPAGIFDDVVAYLRVQPNARAVRTVHSPMAAGSHALPYF